MLRDSQDISDVTLVCGNEDGWRDKRILPQGWKMIYRQQMDWSMDENVVSRKARRYRSWKGRRMILVLIRWTELWSVNFKVVKKETYLSCLRGGKTKYLGKVWGELLRMRKK